MRMDKPFAEPLKLVVEEHETLMNFHSSLFLQITFDPPHSC